MGLNIKLYNIVSSGTYSIRYKSGDYPYPETVNSTFTLYGTGLTDSSITLTGLTFDTQYWIKMTDESTERYIIKNIYTHDSKAFPCYDTLCFDVEATCENIPGLCGCSIWFWDMVTGLPIVNTGSTLNYIDCNNTPITMNYSTIQGTKGNICVKTGTVPYYVDVINGILQNTYVCCS